MEIPEIDILLRLIIAHILADFPFQSNKMAEQKKEGLNEYYFAHVLIVGITTYILLGQWTNWQGPLIIMFIHGVIDAVKAAIEGWNDWTRKRAKWWFSIDQILHLLTIIIYWNISTGYIEEWVQLSRKFNTAIFNNTDLLLIIIAYLVITMPVGIIIGMITKKWRDEIAAHDQIRLSNNPDQDLSSEESLANAGKTIGMIEISLVLTFILLSQYQAIGFLIAAKSVFRFGDLKETGQRKRTEYILIGTLLSFTISIIVGLIIKYALAGSI